MWCSSLLRLLDLGGSEARSVLTRTYGSSDAHRGRLRELLCLAPTDLLVHPYLLLSVLSEHLFQEQGRPLTSSQTVAYAVSHIC